MERLGAVQSTARGLDGAGAQDEQESDKDEAGEAESRSRRTQSSRPCGFVSGEWGHWVELMTRNPKE